LDVTGIAPHDGSALVNRLPTHLSECPRRFGDGTGTASDPRPWSLIGWLIATLV
jgi:hypothetical protein